MEGEQIKLIKPILAVSIIIAIVVFVTLVLQVVQMAGGPETLVLQKDIKDLQKQIEKIATTTKSTIPSQQQMMPQGGVQQTTGGAQGGTMPSSGMQQQGGTQQPTGGTKTGKCGDGTCDTVEKANPTLCPTDCK